MTSSNKKQATICILALPESSGVVLYGLLEVLSTYGDTWMQLTGENSDQAGFFNMTNFLTNHRGGDVEFICHSGKAASIDNPNEQPYGVLLIHRRHIPVVW